MRLCWLALLFFVAGPAVLASGTLPMPKDLSRADLFLHTVDVGEPIYAKFGHTAIRIVDHNTGMDQVYNLGTFDDSDPMFAVRFYTGVMYYVMSDYPFAVAMRGYRYEKRQVWEDRLNFDNDEKRRFLEKMIWQSRPENRSYAYQYFFDNCSTRIRDFFDFAVQGTIQTAVAHQMSEERFRDVVRSHMSTFSFGAMSLDILMNSRLDRKMTRWEEMFLPIRLRSVMMEQRSKTGEPLLVDTKILEEGKKLAPGSMAAYWGFSFVLLLPLVIFIAAKWLLKNPRIEMYAVRALLTLWGLMSGIYGTVMLSNWVLSNHLDLHHNANLLIFFPMDFMFVWIARNWVKRPLSHSVVRRISAYCSARALMIGAAFVGSWTGIIAQDMKPVLLSFGLIGLMNLLITSTTPAKHL